MKHIHLLPLLALASTLGAACVHEVSGLSTNNAAGNPTTPDGAATTQDANSRAQDGDTPTTVADTNLPTAPLPLLAPANTYACGWERSFFKPVTETSASFGRSLVRYDSFGQGSIIGSDTTSFRFVRVLGVGSEYLVATAIDYDGTTLVPRLAVVSLRTGAIRPPVFLNTSGFAVAGTNLLFDQTGETVYVVSAGGASAGYQLHRVNLADGSTTTLPFGRSGTRPLSEASFRVSGSHVTLTTPFLIVDRFVGATDTSEPVLRSRFSEPSDRFAAAVGYGQGSLYALSPTPTSLGLWWLTASGPQSQSPVAVFPIGGGTTPYSIDGLTGKNTLLVSNDREIWSIPASAGNPATPTKFYSYTPVFGGSQPVGISDIRVDDSTNSGLSTFVQPCGEYNGNAELGVRTLPSGSDGGQWLWQIAGFPALPQNRALVSAGGYGYRIANTGPNAL